MKANPKALKSKFLCRVGIQNKNKKHMLIEEEKGRKDVVLYDGICA